MSLGLNVKLIASFLLRKKVGSRKVLLWKPISMKSFFCIQVIIIESDASINQFKIRLFHFCGYFDHFVADIHSIDLKFGSV